MKTKIFHGTIQIDPSSKQKHPEDGYRHVKMDRWLVRNPHIKIVAMEQSHTYTPPTPMLCGVLRIITTVIYSEK